MSKLAKGLPEANQTLWFPLSKEERSRIKEDRVLLKHYHDVCSPKDTLAIVVGKKWQMRDYEYLRKTGINIGGVHLTDEQIDRLDTEGVMVASLKTPNGFSINLNLIDEDFFHKMRKEEKI